MPLSSSWTRSQRRGLLVIVILFVLGHSLLYFASSPEQTEVLLSTFPDDLIARNDSLSQHTTSKDTIYPFNPNFLNEWQAYRLELPKFLVDSIKSRVAQKKYFNSVNVFKQYIDVPDSVWQKIEPLVKLSKRIYHPNFQRENRPKKQLNLATAVELEQVYGIGPSLSSRIIDLRTTLGGFLAKDQLSDVWGIDKAVLTNLWHSFTLDSVPSNQKLDINFATVSELASNHYIGYSLASRIVAHRTHTGHIDYWHSIADNFELDSIRIARIALYLDNK
jgi:competence protein ComEA